MTNAAEDLVRAMKVTAGCRFNAAKRLQFRDRQLTWLTAISSAYVIALTVLPYFFKLQTETADTLNAFTVFYSVVILISSLIQYSTGDVVNAEQHHRSALEINELWREFKIGADVASPQEIVCYTKDYSSILQKFSINHEDVDYLNYQIQHKDDYPRRGKLGRAVVKIKLLVERFFPMLIIIMLSVFVFWLVFGYALPSRYAVASSETHRQATKPSTPNESQFVPVVRETAQ